MFMQGSCHPDGAPWGSLSRMLLLAWTVALCLRHKGRGDVAMAEGCAHNWGGQRQVPVDALLGTSAAGKMHALDTAGGHPSANTARAWPGGFAPQWNSSNLQVPHGPRCLLVYWLLTWAKRAPWHCIKWEECLYRWKWESNEIADWPLW